MSFSLFYRYGFGGLAAVSGFLPSASRPPRSHLLPETYFSSPKKVLIVSGQWFVQPLQVTVSEVWVNVFSSSALTVEDVSTLSFLAKSAAPKAPIRPAMAGLVTSAPSSRSKERSRAVFALEPSFHWPPLESMLKRMASVGTDAARCIFANTMGSANLPSK